ncbi:MAG: hypothetical protein IIB15_01960 [Chloroflexi bacterium]|nr:hypothetical protein [Chloroflexota bacterium]
MRAANFHAIAVVIMSIANVWLAVQCIRWLMYSYPVSIKIPYTNLYSSIDPILEAPGILMGIGIAYFLLYKLALNIWRLRYSIFQHDLMTRVLTINSVLLLALTGTGIAEWIVLFNNMPIDLFVVASIGTVAVLISFVLEMRRDRSGAFEMEGFVPLTFISSLGSLWSKSHKSMSRS